jgi:hypothetical protein
MEKEGHMDERDRKIINIKLWWKSQGKILLWIQSFRGKKKLKSMLKNIEIVN